MQGVGQQGGGEVGGEGVGQPEVGGELGAVGEMAPPDIVQRRRPDQVDPALPAAQRRFVADEPRACFT